MLTTREESEIICERGDQEALLQAVADAVDQTWDAPAPANAGQNAESGTRGGVPAMVSGSAAGRGTPRGLTPSFLMVSLFARTENCLKGSLRYLNLGITLSVRIRMVFITTSRGTDDVQLTSNMISSVLKSSRSI
jgi:hypothetical protein